jgi:hypothetical protein
MIDSEERAVVMSKIFYSGSTWQHFILSTSGATYHKVRNGGMELQKGEG